MSDYVLKANAVHARVQERNARFAQMNEMEARVEIAKDVLNHLDTGKLEATTGVYLDIDISEEEIRKAQTCDVCAIGALFVASLLKYDELEEDEVIYGGGDRFVMARYLAPFFDSDTLDRIECAFEEDPFMAGDVARGKRAVQWMRSKLIQLDFDDENIDDVKLRVIMEEIVRSDGEFKP